MRLRPKSVKGMTSIIMKKNTMPMACQNDRSPKYRQNLYCSGIHSHSDTQSCVHALTEEIPSFS